MANLFKLRKGLDINLAGKAEKKKIQLKSNGKYALQPDCFTGVVPKVVVKEGDKVKAGDALFINKNYPEMKFASPVSGTVTAVERGERRKVLAVKVDADAAQVFTDFGVKDVKKLSGDEVKASLLEAGLFGYINQLPYDVVTTPDTNPKAIFVSALRDKPLAADFAFELEGQEKEWQAGLTALSKMAKTYLGIGVAQQQVKALANAEDVEVNVFDGPCPAGNVSVQVNHVSPVNKGDVVWTVDPSAVIFFGRLFLTGKVNLRRTVALVGSEVKQPQYADMLVGEELQTLLSNSYDSKHNVRIINGNVLTGRVTTKDGFLGAHTSEITVIPEGNDADELAGWIMPRLKQFSVNRSYFSWLFGKNKTYALDARVKGGQRHMIMSGEYDKVIPMDIYPEYLVKAIITGNIDKMEQLGIY
ncbi:MAG: Na(+)-translocating NADH-quinone reductase subunit A, partial [Prevotella sp.]